MLRSQQTAGREDRYTGVSPPFTMAPICRPSRHAKHPWTVRLDGFNLTDARGLHVWSLDVVLPEQSWRFMLTLATDL